MRWRPPQLKTKPDWQDRFKNIRIGKKGVEDTDTPENSTMSVPNYDEKIYLVNMKYDAEAKVSLHILTYMNMVYSITL